MWMWLSKNLFFLKDQIHASVNHDFIISILTWVPLEHCWLTFTVKEYVTIKFIPELKNTAVIFEVDVSSRVASISKTITRTSYPEKNYLFKAKNRNSRKTYGISSKQ